VATLPAFDVVGWWRKNSDKIGEAIWLPNLGNNLKRWGAPDWLGDGVQSMFDAFSTETIDPKTGKCMLTTRGECIKFIFVTQGGAVSKMPTIGKAGAKLFVSSFANANKMATTATIKAGSAAVKQGLGAKALANTAKLGAGTLFKGLTGTAIVGILVWNILTDWVWIVPGVERIFGGEADRAKRLGWTIEDNLSKAHNLIHIDPTSKTKSEALTILKTTKPLIEEYYNLIYSKGIVKEVNKKFPEFELALADFVSRFNTLIDLVGGSSADKLSFSSLKVPEVEEVIFDADFKLSNVQVRDGDTLEFPDHPEVKNAIRMLGLDAHESGTPEGKEETQYLKNLIEGRTVTILTHEHHDPEKVFGFYGRLLGGVFIDGKDVVLKMLEKFGADLLPDKKYRDKYRWINWDHYEDVAKQEFGRGEIKIYSKPAYAEIWIDGEDTGKVAIESFTLEPGNYEFTLKKDGYEDLVETIPIQVDDEIERRFELTKLDDELADDDEDAEKVNRDLWETVEPEEIPETYTTEQEWALSTAFNQVYDLTEGTKQLSDEDYDKLVATFGLYTTEQKKVLNLFMRDVWVLIKGKEQLTTDEFIILESKYRIDIGV